MLLRGILLLALVQFTPFNDGSKVLSGNWQSCRQVDGSYDEKAYDYVVGGKLLWSLHFGPYHDFALFTTANSDDHNSLSNLLFPRYVVEEGVKGEWMLPAKSAGMKRGYLHISIVMAGGSRDECESYFIEVETKP